MKTKTTQSEKQPILFKPELKFMDFWHVSNDYLNTTSLGKKTKHEVMIRIHDFSHQLYSTISLYPIEKKEASQKIYDNIAAGLKETLRRAKISLALNQTYGKAFAAYWKHLSGVLKQDALLLQDEKLQHIMLEFEQNISTIK